MKKIVFGISIFVAMTISSLNSQNLQIVPGWQLLGTISDVNITKSFNKSCIDIVWKYNTTSKSWSAYSPKNSIQDIINSINNISYLDTISQGVGFWVKANSSCTIDTNLTPTDTNKTVVWNSSYDPINQKLSYPGKYAGMYANINAFAALKDDGSVVTWGAASYGGDSSSVADQLKSGVKAIYSTWNAFAALKDDGSVVCWGGGSEGNDSSVADKLTSGVKAIYSDDDSFAALKDDGSVVCWGSDHIDNVADKLKSGVKAIYSTQDAFAALKDDGSVVTWGYYYNGGDSSSVADQLKSGVKAIYSNAGAFAALKDDGSVVTWGNLQGGGKTTVYDPTKKDFINVADKLKSGVKAIYSTSNAFAALKDDGCVVTWGTKEYGGNMTVIDDNGSIIRNVADQLTSGVKTIYSNNDAFAALKDDGSVVTWGRGNTGGEMAIYDWSHNNYIYNVADKLKSGVKAIYSNAGAFAALKDDGSVVTWGYNIFGGEMGIYDNSKAQFSSYVADKLKSGVKAIYSTKSAFAALKDDGSVVTWGLNVTGGEMGIFDLGRAQFSSNVNIADELKSGVKAIYSTENAFAAVKNDGSVVTWGKGLTGGAMGVFDSTEYKLINNVEDKLSAGVKTISKSW